jgi:hypothetical protein
MPKNSNELIVRNALTNEKYVLILLDTIASQDIYEVTQANLNPITDPNEELVSWNGNYYSKKRIAEDENKEQKYIFAEREILKSEIDYYALLTDTLGTVGSWIVMSHMYLLVENGDEQEPILLLEAGKENLFYSYKIDYNENRSGFDVSPMELKDRLDDFIFICWMVFYFHENDLPVVDFKLSNILKTKSGKQPDYFSFRNLAFIDFFNQGKLYEKAMSKFGIRSTKRYIPSQNPSPHNYEGYINISLDIYALVVSFRQMITGVQALQNVTKGDGSEHHKAELVKDLNTNKGLALFLELVGGFNDSDQIEKLSKYFLQYFDLNAFKEINAKISSKQNVPQELSAEYVAQKISELFGLRLVQDSANPEKPWHIDWSSEQHAKLLQAQVFYDQDKEKSVSKDGSLRTKIKKGINRLFSKK